jgi:hypothetical protein
LVQAKNFTDVIPDKHLILGMLYDDNETYKVYLQSLGLDKHALDSFEYNRGIMAFQMRKGYQGHGNYTTSPTGNVSKSLKIDYEIG